MTHPEGTGPIFTGGRRRVDGDGSRDRAERATDDAHTGTLPPVADVTAYVDGFNFYYAVKDRPADKWMDFAALAQLLLPDDTIVQVRYFTAHISARVDDPKAPERQNVYIRALREHPLITVHLGSFSVWPKWKALADDDRHSFSQLFRPPILPEWAAKLLWRSMRRRNTQHRVKARVLVDEEKGSDVNLASFLLFDTLKNKSAAALVMSNDSDLREPIRMAVAEGATVSIFNPAGRKTSKDLLGVASREVTIDKADFAKCLLANPVTTSKGKKLTRPAEWS